jgi:hypothetical protein
MTELEVLNHIENGSGIFDEESVPACDHARLEQIDRRLDVLLQYGYIERPHGVGSREPIRRGFGGSRNGRLVAVEVLYGLTRAGKERLAYLASGGTFPA